MGGICGSAKSQPTNNSYTLSCDEPSPWRVSARTPTSARVNVFIDPTLPPLEDPNHIQLYELLNEPIAQTMLAKYAESIDRSYLLMCWVELEEFKCEICNVARRSKAVEIFDNFIVSSSPHCLKTVSSEEASRYSALIEATPSPDDNAGGEDISMNAFADVSWHVLYKIPMCVTNDCFYSCNCCAFLRFTM